MSDPPARPGVLPEPFDGGEGGGFGPSFGPSFGPVMETFLDRVETRLDSVAVRIVLSLLILVSVLPPAALGPLAPRLEAEGRWFFLALFGSEWLLRSLLFERNRRQRRLRGGDLLFLTLDLLAVVSFLPLPLDASVLRLLRLGRLLVLVGYWRGLGRELWVLLSRPERRFQLLAVLLLGFFLALTSAILLVELGTRYDYNADGALDARDGDFLEVLWWGVRQVQDPGNLVPEVYSGTLLAISVVLTFSGLLLFSFIIGIGTTVVGELVELSRSRRVGLRAHTVLLGLTSHTVILLRGLAEMYRKNLRPFAGAILADAPRPDSLDTPLLRGFRFRHGLPSRATDLDRVEVEKAKRVIILGDDSSDPDAGVISAILATRKQNPTVDLYPDLEHERNFPAARAAGGPATHLVGSGPFLGYYLAQNVAYPGVNRLYRHLLQSVGSEIYTYVLTAEERGQLRSHGPGHGLTPWQLHRLALETGVTLLGLFVAEDPEAEREVEDLDFFAHPVRWVQRGLAHPALDPAGRLRVEKIRGLVGVAVRFSTVTRLARRWIRSRGEDLPADRPPPTSMARPVEGLRLRPDRRAVEKVLILGVGPRAPRLVRELVGFFHRLEITVLAREGEPWRPLVDDIRNMLGDAFGVDPTVEEDPSGAFLRLTLRPEGTPIDARLTFREADWTRRRLLEEEGAGSLSEFDVIVLLLGGDRRHDSDGAIALDLLHLAHLERSGGIHLAPGAHILALVRDPDKGRLLEQRLAGSSAGRTTRYTVIARETARHRFILQSVFVHGLNSIYLELLGAQGQYLSRLIPDDGKGGWPEGDFVPRRLGEELLATRGLLLVGLEWIGETGELEPRVDPEWVLGTTSRPWARVAALYVLGDEDDLETAAGWELGPEA